MISARQRRTSSLSVREKKDGNMYGGLLHKSGKGKKANCTINFVYCLLDPVEKVGIKSCLSLRKGWEPFML